MKVPFVLFSFTAAFFPCMLCAQLSIGVQGGLALSGTWGNSVSYQNYGMLPQPTGVAGVSIAYNVSPSLSLISGINWRQRGTSASLIGFGYPPVRSDVLWINDVLTVPLLAQLQTSGKVRLLAQMGPHVDFLLRSRFFRNEEEAVSSEHTLPVEFGITVVSGVAIPLSEKLSLLILARADMGLVRHPHSLFNEGYEGYRLATTQLLTGLTVDL